MQVFSPITLPKYLAALLKYAAALLCYIAKACFYPAMLLCHFPCQHVPSSGWRPDPEGHWTGQSGVPPCCHQ